MNLAATQAGRSTWWLSALLGATLSLPFLSYLVPWPYYLPSVAAPLAFAVAVLFVVGRQIFSALLAPGLDALSWTLILLLAMNSALIVYGIIISEDSYFDFIYVEIAVGIGTAIALYFSLSLYRKGLISPEIALLSFSWIAIITALIAALIGTYKLALLDDGLFMTFLTVRYPEFYPWGSSIKSDYNFFALAMVAAALLLFQAYLSLRPHLPLAALMVLGCGFFIATALSSGSRRGLIGVAIALVAVVVRELWRARMGRPLWKRHLVVIFAIGLVASAVAIARPYYPAPGAKLFADRGWIVTRSEAESIAQSVRESRALSASIERTTIVPAPSAPDNPAVYEPAQPEDTAMVSDTVDGTPPEPAHVAEITVVVPESSRAVVSNDPSTTPANADDDTISGPTDIAETIVAPTESHPTVESDVPSAMPGSTVSQAASTDIDPMIANNSSAESVQPARTDEAGSVPGAPVDEEAARFGNTTISERFETIVGRGLGGGYNSRLSYWQFGFELATEMNPIYGMGLDYHRAFSCEFANCIGRDYPHNPILSHTLIAGVAGAFFVVLLFAAYFVIAGALYGSPALYPTGVLMVIASAFSFISGDTIFAGTGTMSLLMLAVLLLQRMGPMKEPSLHLDIDRSGGHSRREPQIANTGVAGP